MKTCPHCNHENPDDAKLCIVCSLPLSLALAGEGATRKLEGKEDVVAQARWGTARLGDERKLLLHIRGHVKPLVVTLNDEAVVGRTDPDTGETPDIALDAYDAAELGVSRRHVLMFVAEHAVKVEDLNSANSSFINGQKLMPKQPRILRDGDELRLGRMVIRVHFA